MATSGQTSVAVTSYVTMYLSWTLNSQDTANNTSNITCKAWLSATSGGYISSSASKTYSAVINGTTYSGSNSVAVSKNSTATLFTKTLTVKHDSDGSKTFTFSFSQYFGISSSTAGQVGTVSASLSCTPTSIAQSSSITLASSVALGNACSIRWTPASSSFTYKLKFTIGSKSVTTSTISPGTTSAYTYTGYTFAIATWAPYITTATSATCTATLYTYNGSTQIGTATKTFSVTVPSSVVPTVSIGSTAEGNSAVTVGVYVQNKSTLKVTFTGTSIYSSALKTYTLTIGSQTFSGSCTSGTAVTVTSGTITSSGSVTVKVTVTDARGRSGSASTTVTVYEYQNPQITTFRVKRVLQDGTEWATGEYISMDYAYSVSSLNSKNTGSMTIKYKLKTASSYSTTLTTASGRSGSRTSYIPTTTFSGDNSWDFQITVTDVFGSSTSTAKIGTAVIPISVYKDGTGVAFSKVAEEPNLIDSGKSFRILGDDYPQLQITNTKDEGYSGIRIDSWSEHAINMSVGIGGQNRGLFDFGDGGGLNDWVVNLDEENRLWLNGGGVRYRPYYGSGDSISATAYIMGFITGSSVSLRFMLPLSRPVIGSPTVTVTDAYIRQNGNYLYGSGSSTISLPITENVVTAYGIRCTATMTNTTNVTNNDVCAIQGTFNVTFS